MHVTTIGRTLAVRVLNDVSTVRVSRTADDSTVIELPLAEAQEIAPLLGRALAIHDTMNRRREAKPNPFTIA